MHRHPTLTEWNREEDGRYVAEIEGWSLKVVFRPEKDGARQGFAWEATGPGDEKLSGEGVEEEMEDAMADAEHAAEEARRAAAASASSTAGEDPTESDDDEASAGKS